MTQRLRDWLVAQLEMNKVLIRGGEVAESEARGEAS